MPRRPLGIKEKLIGIFILIKVAPLVVLAWFAWSQVHDLADAVAKYTSEMVDDGRHVIGRVANLASENSIRALDLRSREAIERLTTDTARAVAAFLYDRDMDILTASLLPPDEKVYRRFLSAKARQVIMHEPWMLDADGESWIPASSPGEDVRMVVSTNRDNSNDFHYRPPGRNGVPVKRPLYLEMTFVDLTGQEKIKVTTSDILPVALRDVSKRENTYCKAEVYFDHLADLDMGEIYVSEVIGAYVRSRVIGAYTRRRARERGIEFAPEKSGYAGKENPVGKRFQGLVRWAAPVVADGAIRGWVTLALDHTHLMEFSDHIVPTEERYSPISDAASGNYAFLWDYKGRNISHPRDYFIVGYDPETGEPAVPWLSEEMYKNWEASGLTIGEWEKTAPRFFEQSLEKKPAPQLVEEGLVALDCRYLNFAPQCAGWRNLTRYGGSGSFLIFWSGLWKLTTAAAIPYYTGIYGRSPRGFGAVTIGANVHEFHKAAAETAKAIESIENNYLEKLDKRKKEREAAMAAGLRKTSRDLTLYTVIMIVIVIFVA
ncbi:MAG: sensor histidine kinase, partial [Desulfobacterales bacterium]|nr:sensor histidine kinase [Desulfobacterales bacterium]